MHTSKFRTIFLTSLLSVTVCSSPSFLHSQNSNVAALAAYGSCPAPSHQGVTICGLSSGSNIDAPFQFIASSTSGNGQVKLMTLWADGKKIIQTDGTPFDQPITLAAGTHDITVVTTDTTNAEVKSSVLKLKVDGNESQVCSPPAGAGVNVCDPQPNSCHTSAWTTIAAAGTGKSGVVNRMELWINGAKIANVSGNKIHTNLFITDFSKVKIVEVDSKGASISSPEIVVQSC